MKTLKAFTAQAKFRLLTLLSCVTFVFFSFLLMAQTDNNNPNQYPERSSPAEQSSAYLHSIENDPNGVPNTAVWYAQPWIWAIVASVLILIIGLLFKSYGKRDIESEQGL